MDAFENTDFGYEPEIPEEPVFTPPQQPAEQPYLNPGAGRKESP